MSYLYIKRGRYTVLDVIRDLDVSTYPILETGVF